MHALFPFTCFCFVTVYSDKIYISVLLFICLICVTIVLLTDFNNMMMLRWSLNCTVALHMSPCTIAKKPWWQALRSGRACDIAEGLRWLALRTERFLKMGVYVHNRKIWIIWEEIYLPYLILYRLYNCYYMLTVVNLSIGSCRLIRWLLSIDQLMIADGELYLKLSSPPFRT